MNEPKSRADLFEAAAKMMRMCDEAGIEYWYKIGGLLVHSTNGNSWGFDAFPCDPQSYEFPLAIVEDKPVFTGDELYNRNGVKFIAWKITSHGTGAIVSADEIKGDIPKCCSWNPPKPKTVMVEVEVVDAKLFIELFDKVSEGDHFANRIARNFIKALEELK